MRAVDHIMKALGMLSRDAESSRSRMHVIGARLYRSGGASEEKVRQWAKENNVEPGDLAEVLRGWAAEKAKGGGARGRLG